MQLPTLSPKKEKRMLTKRTLQYISGYAIGGLLVLVLIPWGLCRASRSFDHLLGLQLIPMAGLRLTIAVILSIFGLLLGLWSNVVLNTVGRGGPLEVAGLEVSPKTQRLVVTGPYKYTRNPMLLGACAFYFAIAVYLNSIIAAAIAALFATFMLAFVKLTEERRLLKDFGKDYEEYCQRVPMFVPWIQKRHGRA
ncbi:isoprenylcysteine carboxylmethyltransferase family protein [bacterium]|nr:isoprenylcysteine carboxylmethyltransferase family protein [bacterium]